MGKLSAAREAAVLVATVLAIGTGAAPAVAQSQAQGTFDCEASAIRGSILGQPPVEPVVANRGAGACQAATAGGVLPLPTSVPLAAAVLSAQTTADGGVFGAKGGLADLKVRALPALALPLDQIPSSLTIITVPLPAGGGLPSLPGVPIPGLPGLGGTGGTGGTGSQPSSLTIDLRPALQAALAAQLPNADLLSAEILEAQAGARCNGTQPDLSASSRVAGVKLLGQELPVNAPLERTLKLIDSTSISPASLDLSLLGLPADPAVAAAVRTVLAALPPIAIPETVAKVKVTPGNQMRTANSLTQQALRVELALGGRSVLDLTVGEAVVRFTNNPCGPAAEPPAQTIADAQLQCTRRRLVLIDVLERRGRVRLYGAADRSLVGRTVDIRLDRGKRVARAKVRRDGSFSTTAALPDDRIRYTNRARYIAAVGREKSLNLKLHRRLVVRSVTSRNGKVTIAGRVVRPLGNPVRTITIKRRVTCKTQRVVKRFKPNADGSFRVTLKAPKAIGVAVYRFQTRVRKTTTNPKMYPTFTLPRAVELKR